MAQRKRPMTRTELILSNAEKIIQQRKNDEEYQTGSPIRRSSRPRIASRKLLESDMFYTSTPKRPLKVINLLF
jgi:hypothetical protein